MSGTHGERLWKKSADGGAHCSWADEDCVEPCRASQFTAGAFSGIHWLRLWKKSAGGKEAAVGEEGAECSGEDGHESSEVASRMVMARLGNACRMLSGADVLRRSREELDDPSDWWIGFNLWAMLWSLLLIRFM
ncbi:hypothetical protein B7R77_10200 [Ralstonia solanacearum K60]|uniref:Uncharacterized protein n=1 Tax=Ralstonia solanacearum K60 TaxID=1091042 RepID=A0AAP7ZNM8_RALSL|nr:hypothetical protein B7R77_10200 [Ralstonia solanacearum K60]CCF97813.1 conserved hypothetical protein [Ralstonia solanacearum K60]